MGEPRIVMTANAKDTDPTYLSFEYVSAASGDADRSGALAKTRRIRRNAIVVTGISTLVKDVLDWVHFHKDFKPRILGIRIIGHGSTHGIWIGNSVLTLGTLKKYGPILQKLNPHLTPASYIEFYSCKTGSNSVLLHKLSTLLNGISVGGYDVNQNVKTMLHGNYIGKHVQCQNRICIKVDSRTQKVEKISPIGD